jgi:energy-coupling factor transporter ATP-binding protein EcfA2
MVRAMRLVTVRSEMSSVSIPNPCGSELTAYQLLVNYAYSVIPSGGGLSGKSPLVAWEQYQHVTPEPDDIQAWERELRPSLWGVVTGSISCVVVVDVDRPQLRTMFDEVELSPHIQTPRGGFHYWFRHPGYPVRTVAGLLPGIDVRGDGGFVNVLGRRKDGEYRILVAPSPDAVYPWDKLPGQIASTLDGQRRPPIEEEIIPQHTRNATLTSLAGSLRAKGLSQEAIEEALLGINRKSCKPPLEEREVAAIARSIAKYAPTGEDKEPKARHTSFLETEYCLFEQIEGGGFVQYYKASGEVKIVNHVIQEDVRVLPLSSEEVTLGAVRLPSDIAEYGDTSSLLREVEAHIYRYLDVSGSFRKFASYYVLLSWLYDRFNTLPYLRFIGDTGCGKSRALDVCGGLCYKATSASGCITPAPIYRMLKRWAGTIILDEADLQNNDEYAEVIKILNCGFERNRPVIRALKDNPDKLQILPTFGPKVFATRRRFKDAALEARCLTEIMQETTREDIPATLNDAFYKEQSGLRNKLLLFRFRNYDKINADNSIDLDLKGIEPRLRQISACFASLFVGQPEVLADYQAFITHHQRELIEQRASTIYGQVVEKLVSLIESHTIDTFDSLDTTLIPVSAGDIAESLSMTPQAVGQILKTLGLQTKFIKAQSKRCIVYDPVKLERLKRRYIPQDESEVSMVSMVSTTRDSMPEIDTETKGR